MCGIVGFARMHSAPFGLPEQSILRQMMVTLERRGPDAEGLKIFEHAALGHRRLSILDLSGGAQPMSTPDGRLTLVLNGEIYNYRELNKELEGHGVFARTRSDTETLLNAYAVWGERCLEKLNGMFAFALYDARQQTIFAARDRMGKKPFYFYHQQGLFIFGSEAKAVLEHPAVPREMDVHAAARYLLQEFVPAPYSIYKNVRKLEAGHRLQFALHSDQLNLQPYWDLYSAPCQHPENAPEEYWIEQVQQTLEAAVKRRLVSDVPLGVFLSGGIDSSAVTACMARIQGPENVRTFSIGFDDKCFDESVHARRMAEFIGTRHFEDQLSANVALEILPRVTSYLDEPLADPSILPMYLLSRFARQQVTVALAGDGGDELFAGYDTFKALRFANFYNTAVPDFVDRLLVRPLAGRLPVSYGNFSLDFRVKQFLRGVKTSESQRLWRWLGSFVPEELDALLEPHALLALADDQLYSEIETLASRVAQRDAIDRDGYLFAKTYLSEGVLTKVDRATMACSLEARSPLLDHEFIALACEIPSHLKYRRGHSKYILRRALRELLPADILSRPKKGFGIPLGAWFRGRFRNELLDTLSPRRVKETGLLRPAAVQKMIDDHLQGRRDNRKPLWTLFMFERWRAEWMRSQNYPKSGMLPVLSQTAESAHSK